MTVAAINRFISLLDEAFRGLSANVAMADVEQLAMLIHHSMDQGRRTYHTSTHLFDMCEGMNPRQVLAVLFHDVVYYQLDHGFPQRADAMLKRAIRVERDALMLRSFNSGDLELAICTGVFGFKAGQTLPLYGGMNEFLSAVVAARLLRHHLQTADLLAIVACIEATVPFRRNEADGTGPFDRLGERLRALTQALKISLPDADIDVMVTDAVVLANRDVSSFSETDPATFLATTWLLIEESNAPLAAVGVYSIEDYRGALSRMEKFLSTLDPVSVFHNYKGVPGDAELKALCDSARRNLEFASRYLGTKIVSIAVVEALAALTGGNCPVSMFLGDIRSPYGKPDRVEDFLPPPARVAEIDAQLLSVLEGGRSRESTNDLTASPLTGFIYRFIGDKGMRNALEQAKRVFSGELPARDFLGSLDCEMVRAVAGACAQIAVSRRAALLEIQRSL